MAVKTRDKSKSMFESRPCLHEISTEKCEIHLCKLDDWLIQKQQQETAECGCAVPPNKVRVVVNQMTASGSNLLCMGGAAELPGLSACWVSCAGQSHHRDCPLIASCRLCPSLLVHATFSRRTVISPFAPQKTSLFLIRLPKSLPPFAILFFPLPVN